jgi:hypothetical protein
MAPITDRARIAWIKHQNQELLMMDFSHASVETSLDLVGEFLKATEGRPEKSVLLLTDVTGAAYDAGIAAQWKAARMSRSAMIRASALYGLSGLVGMAIRGFVEAMKLMNLSNENELKVFTTAADAKEWLSKQ